MRWRQARVAMACLISLPTGLQSTFYNLRQGSSLLSTEAEGLSDEPCAATLWETPSVHHSAISELFSTSPMKSSHLQSDESPSRAPELYFPAVDDRIRHYFHGARPPSQLSTASDYRPNVAKTESDECHAQVGGVGLSHEGGFQRQTAPLLVGGPSFVQRDNAISSPSSTKPIIHNAKNSPRACIDQSQPLTHYLSEPENSSVSWHESMIVGDPIPSTISKQLKPPAASQDHFANKQPQTVEIRSPGTRTPKLFAFLQNKAELSHPGASSSHLTNQDAPATLENLDHKPAFHPARVYSFDELVSPRQSHLIQKTQQVEEQSPTRSSDFFNYPPGSETISLQSVQMTNSGTRLQPEVDANLSKHSCQSEPIRDCFVERAPPHDIDNYESNGKSPNMQYTECMRIVTEIEPRLNQTPDKTIHKLKKKPNIPQLDHVPKKRKSISRRPQKLLLQGLKSEDEINFSSDVPNSPIKKPYEMEITDVIEKVQIEKGKRKSVPVSKGTTEKRRKGETTQCNSPKGLLEDIKAETKMISSYTVARRKKGEPQVIWSSDGGTSQIGFPRSISISKDKEGVDDTSQIEVKTRDRLPGLWDFVENYLRSNSLMARSKCYISERLAKKVVKKYFSHTARFPKDFLDLHFREKTVQPYVADLANYLFRSLEIYKDFQTNLETFASIVGDYVEKSHQSQYCMGKKIAKKNLIDWLEDITSRVMFKVTFFRNMIRPSRCNNKEEFIKIRQDQAWLFLRYFWEEFPLISVGKASQKSKQIPHQPKDIEVHQLLQKGPNPPSTYHFAISRLSWSVYELWISQEPMEKELWSQIKNDEGKIHPVAKRLFYDIMTFSYLENIQP